MKKMLILAALFIGSLHCLDAQTLSKTGVMKIKIRNTGTIIQEGQVKGYYYFYNLEKKDRKNINYLLSLYDENLRQIHEVNIVRPKTYALVEGVYNGNAFGFLFYDPKGKQFELVSYDRTLKQTGTTTRDVSSKYTRAMMQQLIMGKDLPQAFLTGVPDKGFLLYGVMEDSKKMLFEVVFYDNNMKKRWTTQAEDDNMKYQAASEAFQDEQYAGSLVVKKKNALSKDLDFDFLVNNIADGKELFRVPMATSKYSISLADVYYDKAKQNFVVFGECYDINDKELKSQSLGFITVVYDMHGKIIDEKVNTWAKDISRAAPVNEKGKMDGSNTNILFHDIIRTKDGQIFAIGEQYKKVVSGLGLAAQALGGSDVSAMQLNVYNMVIFEFNADYTIKKVHFFEKDKNKVLLPAGAAYMSSKLLSYYAQAIGGFDFAFSQQSKDKNTFVVTYINYDREKGQKNKNVLTSIVYTPEKTFSTDRFPLSRKSSEYFVHEGKEGYILVTEYFAKKKTLESRLEKINF